MLSGKGGSGRFETNLKPNGSTGYATLQSILENDLKFDPEEQSEKNILK
jgi:hypothetical protein